MFPFLQQSGMFSVDWRSKILQALSHVFTKERNVLLSELHSYVLSSEDGAMELSDIQRLENKIQTQVGWILLFLEFTIILKVLNTTTFIKEISHLY